MPRHRFEILEGPEYRIPQFSAGVVAEIVGLDKGWKLQKLLGSPRYRNRLKPSGQLGIGRGSRRWFTDRDVYRIAIAVNLIRDGFSSKVVSAFMQDIEDKELLELDEKGRRIGFITLSRGTERPKMHLFHSVRPPEIKPEGPIYYALDFGRIIDQIDQRIESLKAKKVKK